MGEHKRPKENGHRVELLPGAAEQPAAPEPIDGQIKVLVEPLPDGSVNLLIGYTHPQIGAQTLRLCMPAANAVALAHGILGAVIAPRG